MLECHECRCHIAPPCNACVECPECNPCLTCDKPHDGPRDADCQRKYGDPSRWLITKNDTGWKLREPTAPGSMAFDLSTHRAAVILFDALSQAAANA